VPNFFLTRNNIKNIIIMVVSKSTK